MSRCVRVVVTPSGWGKSPQGIPPGEKKRRVEIAPEIQYYLDDLKNIMVVKMIAPRAQSATSLAHEEIRRQFAELEIMGGIPKSEIVHGKKRIDEILRPIEQTLTHGGYIPFVDHFVPPEVDWENSRYFRERLHSMMEKAGGK